MLREEGLGLRGAAAAFREGGLHVRTFPVRAPSDLNHPKRVGHCGALVLLAHETCFGLGEAGEVREATEAVGGRAPNVFKRFDGLDDEPTFRQIFVRKKVKFQGLGFDSRAKPRKWRVMSYHKTVLFPFVLLISIRTRFFSLTTYFIIVPIARPPPGSPQVVPDTISIRAAGFLKLLRGLQPLSIILLA